MALTIEIDHARTRAKTRPVAPDASVALRVTLTATAPGQGDVEFTARDETGATVLRAKDRFVER